MASLENKYGKSAVDATRRNALPPYLDTLFEGGIVNKTDIATTSALGLVKPDGNTVTIDADGTIHSQSSGFGGIEMHGVDLAANAWSNKTQTVTISTYAIATSDFLSVPQIETSSEYSASGVVLSSATVNVSAHTASLVFSCTTVPTATVSTTVLVSTSAMETEIALADAIANYPKIQNGKWYVWNVSTKQWVDTGVKAGITSIVQTTTSTADGGTNVVTATLSDGTKTTFNIKNGQKGSTGAKGDTGAAAGFANPTATATTLSPGSAAAASVTASGGNTMKQFDFSFGIPQGEKGDKGDKGDTGAAAGFGTPTASATTIAAGSSATASVTASGSNTSKVFAFTFGIPKGEKGAKGDTGATGPTGPTGPAGSSIQSIARTSGTGEAGSTDTYTITLTNGNTTTFQVKNGNDGKGLAMRKATLTANGWSNNSQTVQIRASASAASDFLSIPEADTNDIYAGAGVKMTSVSINEGTVDCTFTCTTTPTADVNTVILVSTSNESIEEYLNGIVDDMTDLYNQTEADFNTASGLYVKKAGDTMTGSLTVPTVIGNLTGTATKATSDASGNNIKTTYATKTALDNKVDKVTGKGLSTNDFTTTEKNKLSGIESGAQVNTITGVKGNAESSYRTGNVNLTPANIGAVPTSRTVNGHALSANVTVTASDVGLGNVNNTSDLNKPISTATQTALDTKVDKVTGKGLSTNDFTDALLTKLNGIESGAQVNTVTGVKGNSESTYRTGNINITKANIGLGNVDNTSDANKPISTATQTALDGKVSKSGDTMTGTLVAPIVQTGTAEANYFQTRKMRGEGTASTYYHAIDFGYAGHNQVDFYEYGGLWNFYKNTTSDGSGKTLVGKISANGWEGNVVGDVTGTASNATADGSGNNIVNTYATKTALDNKVDKVTGKGLSANDFTDALLTKLNGIESGAQVNTITGVKGNAESSYRTGNVNLTKANIGLGNVDNTSDANKPISTATQSALDGKVNTTDIATTSNLGLVKPDGSTITIDADGAIHSMGGSGGGASIYYFYQQRVSVASSAEILRISSGLITADTIVLECTFNTPYAISGGVTWTSYDGYISFIGTCIKATKANVVLANKGN